MSGMRDVGHDPYKVNSLTNLDQADPVAGKIVWDPPRSIWNTGMFAVALVLGPLTLDWGALGAFCVLASITLCGGHSVGFHRLLIHRSFECPKWLERVMLWLGTAVGMGGPLWTMRYHDARDWAQRQPDCHWYLRHELPVLIDGFYYLNFKLNLKNPPGFDPGEKISKDRFVALLERTWMAQQIPISVVLYLLGGLPWVVWGVCVRVAACTTLHWAISYRAHTKGTQDWLVDGAVIQAYNVPWLAIPTMGESWHNNHHAFPNSARHGHYPGQIDLGWQLIRLLQWLGLAWKVKLPASLPPRPGITPVSERALDVAADGQAALSGVAR